MDIKKQLEEALKKITGLSVVSVSTSEQESFGDYSTNVAMVSYDSKKYRTPMEYASFIIEKLKRSKVGEYFSKIETAGPGFINLYLKQTTLKDIVNYLSNSKDILEGLKEIGKGKKTIVDYSSPNIAKRFSIGHLRSTIIGQAIVNMSKICGYKTLGDNHIGDWGTQFGKLIYMIDKEKVTDFNIDKLEELYIRFHKEAELDQAMEDEARSWFKKLEDGDTKAYDIWQKCVDVSLKEFEKIYKLLNVKIDIAYGESFYLKEMKALVRDSKVRKHLIQGENGEGLVVDLKDIGIDTPLMFEKSDGATTYATRDLAAISYRVKKWNPDIIVYEVGAEQTLHFQQVFAAARLMGLVGEDVTLHHTKHGLYLGEDGKKFKTRKGGTVKLEDVLDEAIERARKIVESEKNEDLNDLEKNKIANIVGINAIKYYDLSHCLTSDIIFDWENIMNMNGNSAPYIMYTFTRAKSVLEKAGSDNINKDSVEITDLNKEEEDLARTLIHFGEVVEDAWSNFSPNVLALYLYQVSQKFNTFYNSNKIISENSNDTAKRLILTKALTKVVEKGSSILGLKMVERM